MELSDVINRIIQEFGKEVIAEKRFVYMISDYFSFRDNPAEKRVLTAIVNDGYSAKLLNLKEDSVAVIVKKNIDEISKLYGFREDLVTSVVHDIVKSLDYKIEKTTSISSIPIEKEESDTFVDDSEFSEITIVRLYQDLIGKYLHHGHAHMDAQKLKEDLGISISEANRLFSFLVKIGVYRYNGYSQDYDISVSSPEMLQRKIRNYYLNYNGIFGSNNTQPLIQSTKIIHGYLENAIKNMVQRKYTTIDLLRKDLKDNKDEADEIYKKLLELKIINEKGQFVNIYLTPNAIVDKILKKMKK